MFTACLSSYCDCRMARPRGVVRNLKFKITGLQIMSLIAGFEPARVEVALLKVFGFAASDSLAPHFEARGLHLSAH